MKKLIIIVCIFLIAFFVLKLAPLGSKKAMMGASLIEMEVPKLSTLADECCTYEATFKSIRSKASLEKEFKKIVKNYVKLDYADGTYYCNTKDNYTILNYDVKSGFIFNTFHIKYEKGNKCFDEAFN